MHLLLDITVPLIPCKSPSSVCCAAATRRGNSGHRTTWTRDPPRPRSPASRQPEYYGYAATISPAQGATFRRRIRGARVVLSPFLTPLSPYFALVSLDFVNCAWGPLVYSSQLNTKSLGNIWNWKKKHTMPGGTSTSSAMPVKRTTTGHSNSHSRVQNCWSLKLLMGKFCRIANI